MKIIKGWVSTNKVGSQCGFEFEVPDDLTPEEIEEEAKQAMFDRIEWNYTIDGQSPDNQ